LKLPVGKKAIAVAIGITILVFLAHRLLWHRPRVPAVPVKKVEVQGKVHHGGGPGGYGQTGGIGNPGNQSMPSRRMIDL
jgi:hypothetical protein